MLIPSAYESFVTNDDVDALPDGGFVGVEQSRRTKAPMRGFFRESESVFSKNRFGIRNPVGHVPVKQIFGGDTQ